MSSSSQNLRTRDVGSSRTFDVRIVVVGSDCSSSVIGETMDCGLVAEDVRINQRWFRRSSGCILVTVSVFSFYSSIICMLMLLGPMINCFTNR